MPKYTFDVRYEWNGTVVVYADTFEEAESQAVSAAQEQYGWDLDGGSPPSEEIEVYPVEPSE